MFKKLLKSLAKALAAQQIPYMVMGGQAVLLYGEPRMTKDIDVTLGLGVDGQNLIRNLAAGLGLTPLADASFTSRTMVFPCVDEKSGIRVDFIFSWSAYEREALGRTRTVDLEGVPIRFASPEDLILQKVIAGRPRDEEDIRGVLAKNPDCDRAYIRRWLREFTDSLGEPFVERFEQWDKR